MKMEELKALGLSTYQSKALEVLFSKRYTLKELSKVTGIPAGKISTVVKQLLEKGLVQETSTRSKHLYIENVSIIISKLIRDYELKQQSVTDKLHDLATHFDQKANRQTHFFEIGTNVKDNKRLQLRTFHEAEREVLQIINIHHKPKSNRESKTLWEKEIGNAINRGVMFKAIYPLGIELPLILNFLDKTKFQVKRANLDFTRCDIIDSKKVLLKLVHEDPITFGGVIFIENQKFAENLKILFFKFWQEAE